MERHSRGLVECASRTRAEHPDDPAAQLRRLERDLHDGAQARLVAVALNLGLAEELFDTDRAAARAVLAEARFGAHAAMAELRDLVRGLHPPTLRYRGLDGALGAVARDCPVPVDLDVRLPRRLPAAVESALYFTVVEVVTNAVKHSGAGRITVDVLPRGRRVTVRVVDDGRGGADPANGTGLRGVACRLAALGGTLRVTSPVGGPTVVEAELPHAP